MGKSLSFVRCRGDEGITHIRKINNAKGAGRWPSEPSLRHRGQRAEIYGPTMSARVKKRNGSTYLPKASTNHQADAVGAGNFLELVMGHYKKEGQGRGRGRREKSEESGRNVEGGEKGSMEGRRDEGGGQTHARGASAALRWGKPREGRAPDS